MKNDKSLDQEYEALKGRAINAAGEFCVDVGETIRILKAETGSKKLVAPKNEVAIFKTWIPVVGHFITNGYFYQACAVTKELYHYISELQIREITQFHKGAPAQQAAIAHQLAGNLHAALWYYRIAFVEDIIRSDGGAEGFPDSPAARSLKIHFNQGDEILKEISDIARSKINESSDWWFPESILVDLARAGKLPWVDLGPVAEIPLNPVYATRLESILSEKDKKGQKLELLATYLILILGCKKLIPNAFSPDHEIDLIAIQSDPANSYFLEAFGRTFLVECKNWEKAVGGLELNHFAAKLRFHRCSAGVLFSKKGITGDGKKKRRAINFAKLTQLRWYQQDDIRIVVIDGNDLKSVTSREIRFNLLDSIASNR